MSILPGGRVIAPAGDQLVTGTEPVALAVSASGKVLVTVDLGAPRPSLTVMEKGKTWETRRLPAALPADDDRWRSVAGGLAFFGEHAVFVSEGNTGRVSLIDLDTGERRRALDVERGGVTGDLALDGARNILYVADIAHRKIVALNARSRQTLGSIDVEGAPVALALQPDGKKLYVAVAPNLLRTGEISGASVRDIDVTEPRALRMEAAIRADGWEDADLAGILATAGRVFVSDATHDSIAVIDSGTNQVQAQIDIRIPGLETLRGVFPMGMALDESGRLLVAEAGINAVGIIDTRTRQLLGHVPVGWFPTRIALSRGTVYVANGKGPGSGPNTRGNPGPLGSVSVFALPDSAALAADSRFVLEAAGFVARPHALPPLPDSIRHVVLIVKDGRSFDEVLGDVTEAANGAVMGAPQLARFGSDGYVDGLRQRLSLHHLNVTPNHHAIAARWTFSDNFYSDTGTGAEGVHWLSAFQHLARHGVTFSRFGEEFDPGMADTERARRLTAEIDREFAAPGADLPALTLIRLPNDRMAAPEPEAGFPYQESYLADNDVALGRILEYLSGTRWWPKMAVFVTESAVNEGIDHIDAHRTLLLCAGPWARKNSVSHTNAGFPALLKTIFGLLDVPPRDLSDASAGDLRDCFISTPDPAPYRGLAADPRLYQP